MIPRKPQRGLHAQTHTSSSRPLKSIVPARCCTIGSGIVPVANSSVGDVVIRISQAIPVGIWISSVFPVEPARSAGTICTTVSGENLGGVGTMGIRCRQGTIVVDIVPCYVSPGAGMAIQVRVDGKGLNVPHFCSRWGYNDRCGNCGSECRMDVQE